MMDRRDFLTQLWNVLRTNRLRTGLTMFGIVWGVTLILIMGGLSDAIRDSFVQEIEHFGPRQVFMWPGRAPGTVGGYHAGRDVHFTERTIDALRAHAPSLQRVSPEFWAGFAQVKFESRVRAFPLVGAEPSLHDIRNLLPETGRRLTELDLEEHRRVAFIGQHVRERLFHGVEPVGRRVRINNFSFLVVGVAAQKGDSVFQQGGWQDDDIIMIPATTAKRLFIGKGKYETFTMQAVTREASYRLMEEARKVLGALHHFPPDATEALTFFNTVDNVMKVINIQQGSRVLGFVVMLTTLAIGGIGLANILIVSVNERTREIGLRRALGATQREIMLQFLAEALTMTFVAGSIGVALALLISALMRLLPLPALFHTPAMPPLRIVGVFFFMVIVGLVAGWVPARRAAAIDPAIALRYE